jgi:hypothetical protein
MDDEEFVEESEVFLGVGSAHTISERAIRKVKKNPIGFVHFKDPEKPKARRARPKAKAKRRKR